MALLLLTPHRAHGQMITGRVVQQGTDAGIVEALVTISDDLGAHQRTQRTSSQGSYRFVLQAPGNIVIRVRRLGFRPFVSAILRVEAGDTVAVPVALVPVPQELSRVTIDAEVEAIKDIHILGYNTRSFEAVFIPPSRIEAVGKDAFTYLDIVSNLRLTFLNVTDACVQPLRVRRCLTVYVDDWPVSDDPEVLGVMRHIVDPNDIDHIVIPRGGALLGNLMIYTRTYTARQRQRFAARRPPGT
ncbi:MAG: carboxypeptidase-like regulatory domain-containing protein [Gemmatimonadaceae bacterium]